MFYRYTGSGITIFHHRYFLSGPKWNDCNAGKEWVLWRWRPGRLSRLSEMHRL